MTTWLICYNLFRSLYCYHYKGNCSLYYYNISTQLTDWEHDKNSVTYTIQRDPHKTEAHTQDISMLVGLHTYIGYFYVAIPS